MSATKYIYASLLLMVLILGGVYLSNRSGDVAVGSVARGGGYQATSTFTGFKNNYVLVNGPGTLGSVVVTLTNAGTFNLYDGTSTVPNREWGTTTLASFPASVAAGTYTFDVDFSKGLIFNYAGALGSSTITFRQN